MARKNLIWCEVICVQCGKVASSSGFYSPKVIKSLKEETKDWIDHPSEGVLCPECATKFERKTQ